MLFPEGTSTRGAEVQNFKPSLLEAAARLGLPVCYASLSYRTPDGSPSAQETVCWWGDMQFPRHVISLLGLPWFEASIVFGEKPIVETDRKVLASRLHEAVSRHFRAVL